MLVRFRTRAQAARASALTGCPQVLVKDEKKGKMVPGRDVRLPGRYENFSEYRAAVESVSVLYKLISDDGEVLPAQWGVTGAQFEVRWPKDAERTSSIASHFGARRYAYNWALAAVKSDMDIKRENPEHESTPWTLAALRKRWNVEKAELAPWWDVNSKECYATGIADLIQALENWSASKAGRRKGKKVGFPKFKARHKDRKRVRFSTGVMRFEDDRRGITLPVIGTLHSKENTRRVQRHLAKSNARVLNLTISERWGRLFVSVSYAIRASSHTRPAARRPEASAGVDLGFNDLATVTDTDGRTRLFENSRPLRETLSERQRASKQISRRIPGSNGYEAARTKLASLDRRCVHLRREAAHQLTSWLAAEYGRVVIEDLDNAGMKRSMGRRAFRRAVADAALGMVRPMLTYKMDAAAGELVVADRWFASSQIHHGCPGLNGRECRLLSKRGKVGKMDKYLVCPLTGELVDRDVNASANLRDWPGYANLSPVGAEVPSLSSPARRSGECGSGERVSVHRGRRHKTGTSVPAAASETRTSSLSSGTARTSKEVQAV